MLFFKNYELRLIIILVKVSHEYTFCACRMRNYNVLKFPVIPLKILLNVEIASILNENYNYMSLLINDSNDIVSLECIMTF